MPLSSCVRCEKMFNKTNKAVCPACLPAEQDDYEKVREALQGHPEMSAETAAELSGVDLQCILRFLEDGRLETTEANKNVVCGRCGAPAISISKRLCESCLQKLNAELVTQRSQVQMQNKKRVEVGSAFNTKTKTSAVKFQR
jgi:ribosomal protein L37E